MGRRYRGEVSDPASSRRALSVEAVVAVYNGATYLEAQVRSILGQSSPVDRVIVTDDGSDDDSAAIVERVARETGWSDRVVLTRNPGPRGVAANVVHGLSLTSAEIIMLADQDDVWHADKVSVIRDAFLGEPATDLVHSDARLIDASGNPLGGSLLQAIGVSARELSAIRSGEALRVLLRRNVVTGATLAMRRAVIDRAGTVPPGWIHDEWLAIVAAVSGRVGLLERELIDYRQHGANQIGAEALTFDGRIGRLRAPRAERNARLLVRAESLAQRLHAAPWADARVRAAADAKLRHERRRSGLPRARIARIPGVLDGLRAGSYRDYGNGLADAVRDLVQPE